MNKYSNLRRWLKTILIIFLLNSFSSINVNTQTMAEEQVFIHRQWTPLNTYPTPLSAPSSDWGGILNVVGASLYQKFEPTSGVDHDFIPQLAESLPDISENGMAYTVRLREGLKFSNGNSLDAEDVLFTYNLFLTPSISKQVYFKLSQILKSNASITIIDILTIRFEYETPSIFNFETLIGVPIIEKKEDYVTKYNNCIQKILNDCNFDFTGNDVFESAGPYMLDVIDTENHRIEMVKNPFYHDTEVWSDRIILEGNWGGNFIDGFNVTQVAEDKIADLISMPFNPGLFEVWEKPHPYELFNYPHPQVFQIWLNFLHPVYGTGEEIPFGPYAESENNLIQARYVRTAFAHLMDQYYLSHDIYGDSVTLSSSLLPPTVTGFNETRSKELNNFSIDIAKLNLEKAGYDYSTLVDSNNDGDYGDIGDTRFFNFTIMIWNEAERLERVEFMKYTSEQFAKAGIGLEIVPDNITRYIGYPAEGELIPLYENGGFDSFTAVAVYNIPYSTGSAFSSQGLCTSDDSNNACANIGGFQNSVVEDLANRFDTAVDYSVRSSITPQLQDILSRELPSIPLGFGNSPVPKKNDTEIPNAKYGDIDQIRWELVRKIGWTLNNNPDDPNNELDITRIFLISSGVIIVLLALYLFKRKGI